MRGKKDKYARQNGQKDTKYALFQNLVYIVHPIGISERFCDLFCLHRIILCNVIYVFVETLFCLNPYDWLLFCHAVCLY